MPRRIFRYGPIMTACALLAYAGAAAQEPPEAARATPLPQFVLDSLFAADDAERHLAHAQFFSMVGREDLAPQRAQRTCASLTLDPLDEIARRAAAAQIVIINEAHDAPQHRAFIAQLAARLRPLGFSVFAAETFTDSAQETDRAWPTLGDGFYSSEPTFGALLRDVRALGYRLVHYEADLTIEENRGIANREAAQAQNLIDRVFANEPNARVLIHVGHAHLLEEPDQSGNDWMARRLKAQTGIDPLTIEQTRWAAAGDEYVLCDPATLTATDVDIHLGAPNIRFENGRPLWRQHAGQRAVPAPRALASAAEPIIIEARFVSEPDNAVPADRVLLRPGEDIPLLLAPGRYRIEAWTQSAGWLSAIDIAVDHPQHQDPS